AAAARLHRQLAAAAPLEEVLGVGLVDVGDNADVSDAAVVARCGPLPQELGQVLLVGCVLTGIAGRAHARSAAESGRLDARVVGDHGVARGVAGGPRLDQGVV